MNITFNNIATRAQEIINSIFSSSVKEDNSINYFAEFAKHNQTLTFEENDLVARVTRVNKLGRKVNVFAIRFRSIESRNSYLDKQLKALNDKVQQKEIAKTIKKTAKNPYKVGDILNYQFGYSMTLNEYFQVVEVKNMTIVVRQISRRLLSGDAGYQGQEIAIKDAFVNDILLTKRVQVNVYRENISYRVKHENGYLGFADLVNGEYFNRMD